MPFICPTLNACVGSRRESQKRVKNPVSRGHHLSGQNFEAPKSGFPSHPYSGLWDRQRHTSEF